MNLAKQNPVKTTITQHTKKSLSTTAFTKDASSLAPIAWKACEVRTTWKESGKDDHKKAQAIRSKKINHNIALLSPFESIQNQFYSNQFRKFLPKVVL